MDKGLPDLIHRCTTGQGTVRVDPDLLKPAKRGENPECQEALRLLVQCAPGPRAPPYLLGHEPLERHQEVVSLDEVRVDIGIAENLPSQLETLVGSRAKARMGPWPLGVGAAGSGVPGCRHG